MYDLLKYNLFANQIFIILCSDHYYPEELYSSDLVWPCHKDITEDDYMSRISWQIDDTYNFMNEGILRISV